MAGKRNLLKLNSDTVNLYAAGMKDYVSNYNGKLGKPETDGDN